MRKQLIILFVFFCCLSEAAVIEIRRHDPKALQKIVRSGLFLHCSLSYRSCKHDSKKYRIVEQVSVPLVPGLDSVVPLRRHARQNERLVQVFNDPKGRRNLKLWKKENRLWEIGAEESNRAFDLHHLYNR